MKHFTFLILLAAFSLCLNAQIEHTYDFNSLAIGGLDGQDGWHTILTTTGPSDLNVDYAVGSVVHPDASLFVYYNASGSGYGRCGTRKASANFDFDFSAGNVIEFECDMHRNYWSMRYGVGFDADGDGHIAIGLPTEVNEGGIYVQISQQSPANNKVVLPGGSSVVFANTNAGWVRYKMVLDFAANSGQGAVALFSKPGLTGTWQAIPEVQGVNIGLTAGSGDKLDRLAWDGIFIQGQGGTTGFDNILVREPTSTGQLQFIEMLPITNKLTTDQPFDVVATAGSGLSVEFEISNGPATIVGNTVTLDGTAGFVTVKASQPGDATWAAAPDVFQSFEIVDPLAYTADLTIRRPANNTMVYMSTLKPILLVASAYIEHPEVLDIEDVEFIIDSQSLGVEKWSTGYNTAQWTPPAYGTYTMTVNVTTTGLVVETNTVSFEVTQTISNLSVPTFTGVEFTGSNATQTANFEFPTFAGAFDNITTYLDITCPTGGCEPWDRVAGLEVRGPTGKWVELFRYITSYGVPCNHSLDVTDYSSLLQGLVEVRYNSGISQNGQIVDLSFDFQAGEPTYSYSWVDVIWRGTFPFGNYANLQPMDTINWDYAPQAISSKLKIINTGHGWGDLNTGNAAEFYQATHKIKVNNDEFNQQLWVVCNPNPDGCQPQNGTWYHNRAGWCPGSISNVYEYDLTSYVSLPGVELVYEFYPGYVDLCHPSHPDCITGVTCSDCNDGYNPTYIISGNLITYSNELIYTDIEKPLVESPFEVQISPNPAEREVSISVIRESSSNPVSMQIFDVSGQLVEQVTWKGETITRDLSTYPKGMYMLKIQADENVEVKKLIVQ